MKKVNKILMATVAILLSLVLITTSVVSGIFARFIITKDTNVNEITLKGFGVALKLSSQLANYEGHTYKYEGTDVTCASVATNFKIGSGDEKKYAVRIYMGTGTSDRIPTVPAVLKITIDLEYDPSIFKIVDTADTNFVGINNGETKYFMPIGFSFGGTSSCNYVAAPWFPIETTDEDEVVDYVENYIATQMAAKISAGDSYTKAPTVSGNTISIVLTKNKAINVQVDGVINNFYMGFGWPDDNKGANGTDYNAIATYLSQRIPNDATMQIKYTVSIEQTGK